MKMARQGPWWINEERSLGVRWDHEHHHPSQGGGSTVARVWSYPLPMHMDIHVQLSGTTITLGAPHFCLKSDTCTTRFGQT